MTPIAGYLRMSEKSRRVSSKGKEQFRFVPISTSEVRSRHPRFNPAATTILVTSPAASDKKRTRHRADSHMPDLYVLVDIVEEECKDDSWVANIVEIIGESTDLASCATVLMYNRGLTDENNTLQPRPKNVQTGGTAEKGAKCVFGTAESNAKVQQPALMCESGRIDLRPSAGEKNAKYTIFSVDPPGCLDIDDAVHVRPLAEDEARALLLVPEVAAAVRDAEDTASATATSLYEIGVHIADVTNYIKQLPPQPTTAVHAKGSAAATTTATATATATVAAATATAGSEGKVRRSLTEEALHRSFTVYLPHQQVPILPAFLSHDECSLKPGVDKLAVSCIVTVVCTGRPNPANPKCTFKVVDRRFQRSLIRTAGAYSYEQVDEFLSKQQEQGQGQGQDVSEEVWRQPERGVREQNFEVTLRSNSGGAGAGAGAATAAVAAAGGNLSGKAPTSAVKFSLKTLKKLYPHLDSHEMVEQLMLLANTCAAEFLEAECLRAAERDASIGTATTAAEEQPTCAYLVRRQLPARCVPAPELSVEDLALQEHTKAVAAAESVGGVEPERQLAFRGVPVDFTANPAEYLYVPVLSAAAARGKTTEDLTTIPIPSDVEKAHVSLRARLYTHFTSPIRRYADQIVHALIDHYLAARDTSSAQSTSRPSISADPWLRTFNPATVAHINLKQKQHKKFSRDMTIVDFVFDQCATAGRNEVTLDAEAVVLPFRFSDKYKAFKTDLYVFAPCEFVYPVKLHTAAQAQLFDITYLDTAVLLQSRQTGEIKRLRVGDRIAVQVHCSVSAPTIRKKCVVSSPSITFT